MDLVSRLIMGISRLAMLGVVGVIDLRTKSPWLSQQGLGLWFLWQEFSLWFG